METGFIILIATFVSVLGFIIGIFVGQSKADRRYKRDTQYTQGTINIDNNDPEFGPELFLALSVPVDIVMSKKYVRLDINVISNDSHE